ncbi:MAG: helix-turn-helix transcriptional regulator, partial [Gemmatimonadetes bacterium]|nr:helix-turn-helix transcriptional regulator [Gemmatimonadota bacterium]
HVFQILLSLLDGDLHGYSILKDIVRRTDGEMHLGTSTVYAALKRMAASGLLTEVEGPREDESGGPPRQYYRLTERGRSAAREEGLRIRKLHGMVAQSSLLDPFGAPAGAEERP